MKENMKQRYRVFLRPWGTYYFEDLVTGKQETLKTRDKNEAFRLVAAKNENEKAPAFSLHLARVYWKAGDPAGATRTWQHVMDEIPKLKKGNTRHRWLEYVIVRNPARAPKTRMFDGSELERELLNLHAGSVTLPVLSEFVKLRLAKLEADYQRGIPFNEAIGSDELGLDIIARGVLQDWLGNLFAQYDRIAAKLLPSAEAAGIKPKTALPIGEPASARRGAKVNLIG